MSNGVAEYTRVPCFLVRLPPFPPLPFNRVFVKNWISHDGREEKAGNRVSRIRLPAKFSRHDSHMYAKPFIYTRWIIYLLCSRPVGTILSLYLAKVTRSSFLLLRKPFSQGRERTGKEILPFEHIRIYSNTFKHIRTRLNTFEHIRTHSNTFKHVRTHLNTLEHIRIHWNTFKHIRICLNTFEHI